MIPSGARRASLLACNADVLVTMDGARREIRGGGLYAEGNRIAAVGSAGELPQTADRVLDLAGHVVVPGLVNTHHHMFQSLTRAVPSAQDAGLFGWAAGRGGGFSNPDHVLALTLIYRFSTSKALPQVFP